MLETANEYALELLHGLKECLSKELLEDMIICDWIINSGCEYDNQCCSDVSCCNIVQDNIVTCSLSFSSEVEYLNTVIITADGKEIDIKFPITDNQEQQCNITIQEI